MKPLTEQQRRERFIKLITESGINLSALTETELSDLFLYIHDLIDAGIDSFKLNKIGDKSPEEIAREIFKQRMEANANGKGLYFELPGPKDFLQRVQAELERLDALDDNAESGHTH